jgi:hypothetical protein
MTGAAAMTKLAGSLLSFIIEGDAEFDFSQQLLPPLSREI